MSDSKENESSLLDNTVVLYGSSNSTTHNNRNYPLVLAGGGDLGLQHGQYLRFEEKIPMSNLLLTMLHCVGSEQETFSDSTNDLTDILKS
jgi:hypothetical protein